MEPNRLGRVLGISARIAAKKIGEASAQAAQKAEQAPASRPVSSHTAAQVGARQDQARAAARSTVNSGRRLARGAGRAGSALFRPFAHAGGILALEIFGVFFAVFAFSFLVHAWQASRVTGWHEKHAAVFLGVGLLFLWFAVSSFWRAKRKEKAGSR